jgi:3,4-dihydroxy 2-butanone 4-phosphate synthase/GTP cyclohydrolase II
MFEPSQQIPVVPEVTLATDAGEFLVRAFPGSDGVGYLALSVGELDGARGVLARLHSECVTGEVFASRHCDCGPQLRSALRAVQAEGRGVVVYALGHEGRGIGIVEKLRAYALQRGGVDTVDANLLLGLPVDVRNHHEFAGVLARLGLRSVRLMTNNPDKAAAVEAAGVEVEDLVPLHGAPHLHAMAYFRAKQRRLGHVGLLEPGSEIASEPPAIDALLGPLPERSARPSVVLKFAQTLDGRIAAHGGDSRWISGTDERRLTHALRSACDAVLVGVGTVVQDDPQLTVRMVPGASPARLVLDPALRTPVSARLFDDDVPVIVLGGVTAREERRSALVAAGARVIQVPVREGRADIEAALRVLHDLGIRSILVEGGARVITSFLASGLVDRVIVSVAPIVLGRGIDAVEDLGSARIADALRLEDRVVRQVGEDIVIAGSPIREARPSGVEPVLEGSSGSAISPPPSVGT